MFSAQIPVDLKAPCVDACELFQRLFKHQFSLQVPIFQLGFNMTQHCVLYVLDFTETTVNKSVNNLLADHCQPKADI